MFALAAFGAASLRPRVVHLALAVALIALSLGRTHHAIKHPYEAAWRQATEIAAGQTAPDEPIAVFPEYCKNVVRYYLSPERRSVVQGEDTCGPQRILILSGRYITRRGPDRRHGEVLSAGRQAAAAGGGSRTLMGRTPGAGAARSCADARRRPALLSTRAAELSADEAASWAGAAAPDLRTVIERERSLDPGKLALYDLALHGWIALGGDGVGSMRAFSAVLGTLTIALVFAATRELMLGSGRRG